MAQSRVALRFLFNRGAFLDVVIPEHEALLIVNDFASTNPKPSYKGGPYENGAGRWGVKTDGLVAVYQVAVNLQAPPDGGVGLGADRAFAGLGTHGRSG